MVLPLPSIPGIIERNLMDEGYYAQIATNLVERGEFLEGSLRGYRPPGYPFMVAVVMHVTPHAAPLVQALQHLMYATAAAGLVLLAVSMGGGLAGTMAGALLLSSPGWLLRPQQLMSETLFLVLLVFALLLVHRWRHGGAVGWVVLAGLLLGASTLVREFGVFHVAALTVALVAFAPNRHGLLAATMMGLAAVAVVLPWTARNNAVFGRPIPVTTNGPINLYLGNNPGYQLRNNVWRIPERAYPFWNRPGGTPADELMVIDAATEDATAYIRSDVPGFLHRGFGKSWGMWGPVPVGAGNVGERGVRLAKNLWWFLVAPLACWGLLRTRQEPVVLSLILAVLAAAGVHFITVGNANYRLPWEALFALPAALALAPMRPTPRDIRPSSMEQIT